VQVSLTSKGQDAVLRVIDHGAGIHESKRKEAIEPFVRLDQARTRSGNVGLGLALAVIISQAHSGSLTLGQSATGGLEVQVNLPLTVPDQIATDIPSS
jgi:two-component system osmolarity sensor histidine kinase EnvZ